MDTLNQEQFSLRLDGSSLNDHSISIKQITQSLNSLESILHKTADKLYGKKVKFVLKVKGGFQAGSFDVNLILDLIDTAKDAAYAVAPIQGCFDTFIEVLKLAKFLKGSEPANHQAINNMIEVTNCKGDIKNFNNCTFNIYNTPNVVTNLDNLTSTLDDVGVDTLQFSNGLSNEEIRKSDRPYFKQNQSKVIKSSETNLILEVITPKLNGDPKNWGFYDGSDFNASIEDEDFLNDVKEGKITFKNGTQLDVLMRIVQRRGQRLITERTIIEVNDVIRDIEE